ncbi:MAG: hypothetical protein GXP37_00580, partial [Chloroflexi bacterium]|nr:hypothetical protein [Chloroflexota bacterium]
MKPSPLTALFDHSTSSAAPKLTLVLGGGGARGALQVGALRYLMEQGITPDLMVGTSIGAVNATFLAIRGFTLAGIEALEVVWHDAAAADLLPANYIRITARFLFNRVGIHPSEHRLREFLVEHDLSPDIRYADLKGPPVVAVATDLNTLHPVLYGRDPKQSVMEGLMASTAVPPWIRPLDIGEHLLMDGGVLSNLPIEPALQMGATDIIAMDLFDARQAASDAEGVAPFFLKLLASVELRQIEMELALAAERHVPVRHVQLIPPRVVPIWDFSDTNKLITRGYELAREQLAGWEP